MLQTSDLADPHRIISYYEYYRKQQTTSSPLICSVLCIPPLRSYKLCLLAGGDLLWTRSATKSSTSLPNAATRREAAAGNGRKPERLKTPGLNARFSDWMEKQESIKPGE